MSWSEGRRLSSLTTGGNTTTYTYDLNGLRSKKVNPDGTWVKYFIADGKIIGETLYRANNNEVYDMRYTFDENGDVCGISIWRSNVTGWEKYYFLKNLQGDVLAIYKAGDTFTKVGEYTYDSWGNVLSVTGVPSNDNAATLNPFRYRSYYQDPETGFYYLQSRYYDPAIGRFINSDEFASTGQDFTGYNMFAYCGNNPIIRKDESGEFWVTLGIMAVGGLIGAGISAISSAVTQKALTGSVNWRSVGVAAVTGFVSGAVAASPLGIVGQQVAGGVIGGLSYAADCYVNDKAMKLDEAVLSVGMGVISGRIGGSGANEKMILSNASKSAKQTIARETRRANQRYAQKVIAATISSRNNTFASIAWAASFRFAAGTGVSNGINGKYSSLGLIPSAPTWKPW